MSHCTVYWYGGAGTAADRMCAVARYYDISSKKQIVETFLSSMIKNRHIEHPYPRQKLQTGGTGPQVHSSVGPQRARPLPPPPPFCTPLLGTKPLYGFFISCEFHFGGQTIAIWFHFYLSVSSSSSSFYLSHTRLYRDCITSSEMWDRVWNVDRSQYNLHCSRVSGYRNGCLDVYENL